MIDLTSTQPMGNDGTVASNGTGSSLQELADKLRSAWSQNHPPSLASYLKEHSELCSDNSLVIDLAIDEYRLRRNQGQVSSIGQYCKPFSAVSSAIQSSIYRQIEVERYLDDHPELRLVEDQTEWPSAGDEIVGYHVLEELGRGALARVYLCSQSMLGNRQVVVKVSSCGTQEGHTLGKLQHPHIMPIHSVEIEEEGGLSYLCTPFLGRSTLRDLICSAFSDCASIHEFTILEAAQIWSMPSDRVSDIISPAKPQSSITYRHCSYVEGILVLGIKLCDALAYAHTVGIIHGDLKPSNILLTPAGEPVLLDFNLARDDDLSLDVRGGTLPYMAPEQITQLLLDEKQDTPNCDGTSEVFSLGVVLYELLSGELPFEIDREAEDFAIMPKRLLDRQRQGPPLLADRNSQVGSSLAAKINLCLSYRREARFSSMDEFRTALLEELSPMRRVRRWRGSHRRLVTGIVLCASATLIAVSIGLATRPPYYLRQYQNGVAHQSTGEHGLALASFEKVIAAEPNFLDAKFAVARANLALGKVEDALKQFLPLATEFNHPASMACVGYCFNLRELPTIAIPWYKKTLEAGFSTVGIHNNLAVSYELGNTQQPVLEQVQLASTHIERALQLAPTSEIVCFNGAIFELLRFLNDSQYVPHKGLDLIHSLIKRSPDNPELYFTAIRLYAAVAQSNPVVIDDAINMLLDAGERGIEITIKKIRSGQSLQIIYEHPRFSELQRVAGGLSKKAHGKSIPRFIDPIVDEGKIKRR